MMTPKRIQRECTRGWRMPDGAIYVGRPSEWGNPYDIVQFADTELDYDARGVLRSLRRVEWMVRSPDGEWVSDYITDLSEARRRAAEWFEEAIVAFALLYKPDWLEPLRGHDLACWCPLDHPCHADVLLRYANREAR